jgi:hypothetical protein
VASWQKCTRCHKVRQGSEFPAGSDVCSVCLTAPAARPRAARASTVKTVRPASAPVARDFRGAVGSGDLEVRERRAKKDALEQLAELHSEDYVQLLQAARRAEGLRG